MANLAQSRQKKFAERRANRDFKGSGDTLSQIRTEGYEDYSYGSTMSHPYIGTEANAYREGWEQAHLEMTGKKL